MYKLFGKYSEICDLITVKKIGSCICSSLYIFVKEEFNGGVLGQKVQVYSEKLLHLFDQKQTIFA
jgi:hypothetical protein